MNDFREIYRTAMNIFHQEGPKSLLKRSLQLQNTTNKQNLEKCNQKILQFALSRSQHNSKSREEFLRHIFRVNSPLYMGLPEKYISIFLTSIDRRIIHHDYTADYQDTLIQLTKDLNPLCLSSEKWLALQYFCLRNGLFKTAYFVRQKAAESSYSAAKNDQIIDLATAFKAAIDQGEFEKAKMFLNHLNHEFPIHIITKELDSYYDLNTGNVEEFQKKQTPLLNTHDQIFKQFIEGKTIAVVGPAPSMEECGEEIDSFDVVIRMKYRGRDSMPEPKEFGNRVDISYYGMGISDRLKESKGEFFKDINFAVFKSIDHSFQKQLFKLKKGRCFKKNKNLFNESPLETNHAIYDILHFNPAKIKLFKVNFSLSPTPYTKGYNDNEQFKNYFEDFNFRGFAHHDILSNINFTRNLWNSGLIDVDNTCRDVICMGTYEYLNSMEKIITQQ